MIKNSRNVIVITDHNEVSGMGNLLRSKYLYLFLKKKKFFKLDFQILSKKKKNKKKYDIIILDLPNNNYDISEIVKKFSKKKHKIIALDYNFKFKINYNISIFKKNNFAHKNYVGLKYAIIRDEFLKHKIQLNNKLFFISIGSSDINKIKNNIKEMFSQYFKEIYLNPNLENKKNKNLNQKKYLKKMISCKMAASNGGTTLLELLFLKKIVFVYPQNLSELNFSNYLKKKGFNILINDFKINKKKIFNLKKQTQNNFQIDEYGVQRISKIIIDIYNNFRL